MLDIYDDSFRNMAEGEVVKGTVLKVTDTAVVVDVGYKSEGLIPIHEFLDENGQVTVQAGDMVDVLLERTEDREGHIVLSREKAEKMKIWDEVEKAYAERKVVIGRVIERIKGGLAVDIGVRALLPGSQIDVPSGAEPRCAEGAGAPDARHQGQQEARQHRACRERRCSRKRTREEEDHARNACGGESAPRHRQEHHRLRRLHRSRWHRRAACTSPTCRGAASGHPSELFKVNDEVDVIVLKYDPATERVSLGHKQLVQDPWATVQDRYPVGARMSGKVVSLTDYGAFVELEPGVEGLIHVSEMSWSKRVKHPSKFSTSATTSTRWCSVSIPRRVAFTRPQAG
jgi:small subunit ribosomal protein S1